MTSARVKVLESVLDVSAHAWDALVPPGAAPVLRHAWLAAMEQSGSATPERGWRATHFTLWRGERLIGATPAWRKTHSMGEYVYDFGWANAAEQLGVRYFPKLLLGLPLSPLTAPRFLAAPGEDLAVVRSTLLTAALDYAQDQGCSSVHVLFPPQDEAQALEGLGLFHRSTMQFHWKNPGYRTYEDYLARFDSKRRHQLRRERGAAAKQGLTLRTVGSAELNPEHAELAWRFYEATASRHAWGPVQLTRDFFWRVFATMPDALELVLAERGGARRRRGLQPAHAHPPVRPLLGVLRRAPVSALQRVSVPLHRRLHWQWAARLRARRGRRAQGLAGVRAHPHSLAAPGVRAPARGGHSPGLRSRSSRGGPTDR
jgi:predicted N-acyltransferase